MTILDIIASWIGHAVLLYVGFIVAVMIVAGFAHVVWSGAKAVAELLTGKPWHTETKD